MTMKLEKGGERITGEQFRVRHPNAAFRGDVPSAALANAFGYVRVVEPDPLPWQTYKEARIALSQWINNVTSQITSEYPDVVQRGWEDEEEASKAFFADNLQEKHTALLTRLGTKKGRTVAEQAAAIKKKADAYRQIQVHTQDLFTETEDALAKAESPLEYEAIFDAAKKKVAPLAEAFGLQI